MISCGPSPSGNNNPTLLLDPQWARLKVGSKTLDQGYEYYYPKQDHYRVADPGFTLGGPVLKDRLWFFLSANPNFTTIQRTVAWNAPGTAVGPRIFNQNNYTYYSLARAGLSGHAEDPAARVLAVQLQPRDGVLRCRNRTTSTGSIIGAATANPDNYNSGIGNVSPNVMYTLGADVTLTPTVVATTRFGYWAYNGTPETRGLPSGIRYIYRDTNYSYSTTNAPALASTAALNGQTLGAVAPGVVNSAGWSNIGANTATLYDWWRR